MSNTYTHAVIDLETLSTRPEAVVVAIGAVKFDPLHSDDPLREIPPERGFYRPLKTSLQVTCLGRHSDSDTEQWWLKQGGEARRLTFAPNPVDPAQALSDFATWMRGVEYLWGNGAAFDNAILRSLCAGYGAPYPISYKNDMDLRTLRWAAGHDANPPFVGVKHYALHDAANEARVIQDCYRRLKIATRILG